MRLNALFRLAFASASHHWLTLPHTVTRRLILQKARRRGRLAPTTLRLFVNQRFQGLFHSPPGVLFTFPSRYWFTIGRLGILRLTGWSPQIHAGLLGPGATWDPMRRLRVFRVRGYYPLWPDFPDGSTTQQLGNSVKDLVLFLVIPRPRISNATRLDTDTV